MLFMDVALFDGHHFKNWMFDDEHNMKFLRRVGKWRFIFEMRTLFTIFDWLSIVHGFSMDEVKKRLSELKRRSLLEELGDGTSQIGMHDLWREFAAMETKHGEEGSSHWVYEHDFWGNKESVDSCMAGGGWKKLRRICIRKSRVKHMDFSECSKVMVLRLNVMNIENGALDLSHMKLIKSLEIVPSECPFYSNWRNTDEEVERPKVSGIGQLLNLGVLVWTEIGARSFSAVEEVSCLTNLQILHLKADYWSSWSDYKSPMSLDLQQLRYLQYVRVELPSMVSISGFSSKMKSLRILDLTGCCQLRSCLGVGNVDGLEVLFLTKCGELEELLNLQKLIRLRILGIQGCKLLKALPGLGSLVALQAPYGGFMPLATEELPSMRSLSKLEVLDLRSCYELKCIPGLSDLIALRELQVTCRLGHDLPDLRNLTKLQAVVISGRPVRNAGYERGCGVSGSVMNLAMLESISELEISDVDHELANLNKLTALNSLKLSGCNFERLPHMGKDMLLESLSIERCGRLRGWDGVRGLWRGTHSGVDLSCDWTLPYLTYLQVDYCQSLELLDLRHFPQLKTLFLHDSCNSCDSRSTELGVHCHASHVHLETLCISCSEMKELPDLRKFPSLQKVYIFDCNSLTNLTIDGPIPALRRIKLDRCRNLRTVPNTNLFPRLNVFSIQQCGVQLHEHEVQKLIARGFLHNVFGDFWREPSSDVVEPPAGELNWHADEQVAMDAPISLAAGPPLVEPCTSDHMPYDESLSELGISRVPKRALELGSSSDIEQEQTKKLKNIE